MIDHIEIKNFAIIENAEVSFNDGLNIITGETGAGKSIVIEAISLALGARADSSYVRHGMDKATVSLIGTLDGEEVIVTREITREGKNICKLNGEIVSLSALNEKTKRLADIHGQYDNQSLLNPEYHIELLDKYRKEYIDSPKEEVASKYSEFSKVKQELIKLLNLERENKRKLDFFKFEIEEIDKAQLKPNEDVELNEKVNLLQNSEKIFENLELSYQLLSESSPSILEGLSQVKSAIDKISKYSAELAEANEVINDSYIRLDEVSNTFRDIRESLSFSTKDLDDSITRLNLIENLKKKYGNSIEEILTYRDNISSEISMIENFEEEKTRLEAEVVKLNKELLDKCSILTDIRKEVALELSRKIEKELEELNFKDAKIEIRISELSKPTENGIDNVEIYISTNIGEPLKPLHKTVSGGEMSRIMLAFKNVISSYDNIHTLIFDEIDNGISGETASVVGKKLLEIGSKHQIICITHLPQIAAIGQTNFMIKKENDDSKTYTDIVKLDNDSKIREIARLIGGTTITENTLISARELVNN